MDSVYLAESRRHLPLTSEVDLQSALDGGLLGETHFLELKREIPPGKASNKETAKDLAQFAVDGGTVIVGIEEHTDGTLERKPLALAGLPERLEQIATTLVDPPLALVIESIPTANDATSGYLIVNVPASPLAPHMVDDRYMGRGDKTKRYLSDPEVLRLHAQRVANEIDGVQLLRQEVARDPFATSTLIQAHGFWLAQPVTGRPEMMLNVTDGDLQPFLDLSTAAIRLTNERLAGLSRRPTPSPDISEMGSFDRRTSSLARTSYSIDQGRQVRDGFLDKSAAELELFDDGGVRIFTSHLGHRVNEEAQVVIEGVAVAFTHHLLALTQGVANEAGYHGNWVLAFGASQIQGAYSATLWDSAWGAEGSRYGEKHYERTVTASYADLVKQPRRLADQLAGGLLRALRTRHIFLPALQERSEQVSPGH